MTDVFGTRAIIGVLGPSTNTIVQPEFEAMRPKGVTNHYSRIYTPDAKAISNETFLSGVKVIGENISNALQSILTCDPSYIAMGMSAVTFFGGAEGAVSFQEKMVEKSGGLGVSTGALSCIAALQAYGSGKNLAIISPYFPAMNSEVSRFFSDYGYKIVRDHALECQSWTGIARVEQDQIKDVIFNNLDGDDVDAIIQVGTNLRMAHYAPALERLLGKPVIAINTATYWHAMRSLGISDKVQGFGKLLSEL